MASNQEQMGQDVNYHKRLAMGAKLDGSSLGSKEPARTAAPARRSSGGGALAQAKKK
jgi:hypothetical protein